MKTTYQATKLGYVLEPLYDRDGSRWQSHHVTNPTLLRLEGESRIYLGYRAGGDRDHYVIGQTDCFSSALGLAVLDEFESVKYRFPLPIFAIRRDFSLPQSPDEYPGFIRKHGTDLCVLHDFRFFAHEGYLYLIYHDGTVDRAYDCVRKMPTEDFRRRIDLSIGLCGRPTDEIAEQWASLWPIDAWEPCGAQDRLFFPTVQGESPTKTDIVFWPLDHQLQMMHRPLPDVAVVPVSEPRGVQTPDGDVEFGVLEQCIRPGFFDNSHIGPNGMPSKARIGDVDVYIDICHGVHNEALTQNMPYTFKMTYSPFFRIKNAKNGDLLYYSELPILDPDDSKWSEYTRNGRWVQALPHEYIVFVGGQIERYPGKNTEDDPFVFFAGVGDTAIAKGEFTIRDLTPSDVLRDISLIPEHMTWPVSMPSRSQRIDEKIAGWNWQIGHDESKRTLVITRSLMFPDGVSKSTRIIPKRPGYFDADLLTLQSVIRVESLGYCVLYSGVCWSQEGDRNVSRIGQGLLVLDDQNLERVWYRSSESLCPVETLPGYVVGDSVPLPSYTAQDLTRIIPAQMLFEIERIKRLTESGEFWGSHHTQWLKRRAKNAL